MIRRLLLTVFVVSATGATAFAQEAPNHPPRPRVIAWQCAKDVRGIARRTVRDMHIRANRCVSGIRRLLEHDKIEEAHRLARECSEGIGSLAERSVPRITARAEHCLALLDELEAPERLKAFVRRVAEAAVNAIQEHRERVLRQIHEALPE